MMAMLKNRFAKKFPMLPDVYVVYYEGKNFLTMRYRQQQMTAPAEMTLPEFVRNRLLGLLPDATATPPWMPVESEFADENIQVCMVTQVFPFSVVNTLAAFTTRDSRAGDPCST